MEAILERRLFLLFLDDMAAILERRKLFLHNMAANLERRLLFLDNMAAILERNRHSKIAVILFKKNRNNRLS
jgi:type IV secretory pathway VirD2 relaxase